jgi:hypothetical protein
VEERRKERIAALERQLKRAREDNAKLERKLGHLTKSRSWQVTAPLRLAGTLASRASASRRESGA